MHILEFFFCYFLDQFDHDICVCVAVFADVKLSTYILLTTYVFLSIKNSLNTYANEYISLNHRLLRCINGDVKTLEITLIKKA